MVYQECFVENEMNNKIITEYFIHEQSLRVTHS